VRGFFSANNKVGQEFIFQTNSSGGTTFDPVVAMNGSKRASWNLGERGSYFAGNSVSYTYRNSFTKTIKLRTNRLVDVTSLNMTDDGVVGVLNLTGFTSCLDFSFNTNANLTGVTLPTTNLLVNSVRFMSCNLHGNLDLSVMPNFGGAFSVAINPKLKGLTIPPSSTNAFNLFAIDNCDIHGRIDLSGYTKLGGQLKFGYNANITGFTFPNSTQNITQFYIGNNDNFTHDLIISGLTGLGGIVLFDNIKSSNIIFPNSSNNITSFSLNACNSLSSVNLTSLSGIGGSITLQGNTGVTSYALTKTSNLISDLSISQNSSLTNLDLSPLSGISTQVILSNNIALNNLILPSVFAGPVTNWQVVSGNLPASGVNYVLYTIDNTGWTSGTINISGGGNSAPDGSSGGYNGTASALNLVAKSWSVTTN
jgi:hypothetical protein